MAANLLRILVVQLQHQVAYTVAGINALLQLTANKRQLEVEVVSMARLQVVQQGGNADLLVVLKVREIVDGEIHHRQKRVAVHTVQLTCLGHRLVAKAKTDAEAAQGLQHRIIILDERNHLILRLIHLQILHNLLLILCQTACKSNHFFANKTSFYR